jgi:HEPN domain-containing protein
MTKATAAQFDPLRIYIQAERFLFADEKLRGKDVLTGPEIGSYVVLPCVVMQAFSIELYLKCLIGLEGRPVPRGHHLRNLFDRLNGKSQKELAALWLADHDSREALRNVLPSKWRDAISDDVGQALSDGSRAFEELRYAYEREPVCRFYIDTLPRMLRGMIWARRPEWRGLGPAPGLDAIR